MKKLPHMILLALFAALVLTACQTETPETDAPPVETAAPVEEATATTPPEPTDEPEPTDIPAPSATATDAPTPTPDTLVYEPVFDSALCQFDEPLGYDVECGNLTVPENRDNPNTNFITLHVAKFASVSSSPSPDPIVYLSGGPGGEALDAINLSFEDRFAPMLANHDLIIFDQRGVGFSEPELSCTELVDLTYELLPQDISVEDATAQSLDAITACRTRLAADGVDLTAYNSAENAADVNDLRIAMGYEAWNLLGVSYGTRLGLTVMRDFPEGVRSIVLDSSLPLQVNLDPSIPANVDRAYSVLFEGCRSDPVCSEAYPDLETVFYDAVAALDETPASFPIYHALEGDEYEMLLDGAGLMGFVFQSLYSTEIIPALPGIIFDVSAGNYARLAQLEGSYLVNAEFISQGMHYSVQCHEDVHFSEVGDVADAADDFPNLSPFFQGADTIFEVCEIWDAGESDAFENLPVESDIQTLILAGEYDPITPPSWGQIVGEGLPNSTYLEFPGFGHGPSLDGGCPQEIMLAFFGDPTTSPDASCIADIAGPAFRVPRTEITLEPFTDEMFGLNTLLPEGWEELGPGVYGDFDAALLQFAVAGVSQDFLRDLILEQLEVSSAPESSGTYEGANFTWSLYKVEITGLTVDLAVAEDEWGAFLVLMQPPIGERDFFYNNVLLPVLDVFESTN